MSSCMALPHWVVFEKLGVGDDDFRHCLLQAIAAGVVACVKLAFDPEEVPFLNVGADVLGDASVGNDSVPLCFVFVASVGVVDRLVRCYGNVRCRRAATRLHQLRGMADVAEQDGFVDRWHNNPSLKPLKSGYTEGCYTKQWI